MGRITTQTCGGRLHDARRVAPADMRAKSSTLAAFACALMLSSSSVSAAPPIRTSDANRVPACVTPERLTAFLTDRNPSLDPRYREIARWYKVYGDSWRVRWDYAFFQMILETNALKYRRADGRRGDVHENQNNFAGIGATGRGAPGDRYPDIKTGVHAQIQHLVAYSGEMLAAPIAPRTQLVQDSIVAQSRRLRRAVTFGDLARRWAVDRAYARSIDGVAENFRASYCNGVVADARPQLAWPASKPPLAVPQPQPAVRRPLSGFAPPARLGGPQPQRLQGPDTLPWTSSDHTVAQSTSSDAERAPPPARSAPPAPQRAVPPVRTIWSRDGALPPPVNAAAAPAVKAPAPAEAPSTNAEVGEAPDAATGTTAHLPQFRIGPQLSPPQRLGGPVDVPPVAAPLVAPQPAPRVQFKNVVRLPSDPNADAASPADAAQVAPCRVLTASYGGRKTLLVRAVAGLETRYTALTVHDGFEKTMFDTYARASAPDGADIIGAYDDKDQALADARANCPEG